MIHLNLSYGFAKAPGNRGRLVLDTTISVTLVSITSGVFIPIVVVVSNDTSAPKNQPAG